MTAKRRHNIALHKNDASNTLRLFSCKCGAEACGCDKRFAIMTIRFKRLSISEALDENINLMDKQIRRAELESLEYVFRQ